jgi:CheY-like chemotaxis protein
MSKSLVLYADDDDDDKDFVTEAFSHYGDQIELKTFTNGSELLHYLKSNPDVSPCLIIMDINMPRVDGKDALRLLRNDKRFIDTPVVLFTTSSLPADTYFAKHYKAGFITKPIDLRQMDRIVEKFLDYCSEEEQKKFNSLKP